jgi:ABC-2 type transport system permease protein
MSKLLLDTRLIFGASLNKTLRNPVWALIGLFQPALYLLLFAPLLGQMMGRSAADGAVLQQFTPGLLIMMSMFGSVFAGFGLIDDLRSGVVERLRVTPVSRLAMLLGRVLMDVLTLMSQCAVLIVIATLMGLRTEPVGLFLTLVLVALIGAALAALSYALAILTKDEGGLASIVNTFTQPVLLLSGVLLPMAFAPALIKTLANINPFSHAVDAARALFVGQTGDPSVLLGFGLMVLFAALTFAWATRMFRTATA